MARSEGLALLPYNVLAEGKIRTDEEEERRRQTGEKGRVLLNPNWERTEKQKLVCKALEKVAGEVGAKNITAGMNRSYSYEMFFSIKFGSEPSFLFYSFHSRHSIRDAEGYICLPYRRRSQS